MNNHPLASYGDPNALMGTVMAAHNLLVRQALSLEHAWAILLQREHGPGEMPDDQREPTRQILKEFGYREFQVTPADGGKASNLWIRPDWPNDRIDWVPLT